MEFSGTGTGNGSSNPPVLAIYYHHSDHLGSNAVVSENGAWVQKAYFTPFGVIVRDGNAVSEHLFTDQENDETELAYFGARHYDPWAGRFLSVDPVLGLTSQGMNGYSYALNAPTLLIDPDGRCAVDPVVGSSCKGTLPDGRGYTMEVWSISDANSSAFAVSGTPTIYAPGGAQASGVISVSGLGGLVGSVGLGLGVGVLSAGGPSGTSQGSGFGVGDAALIAGGFVPGVGEAIDLGVLFGPGSTGLERTVAGVSLAVNFFTAGFAPNFGGFGRLADDFIVVRGGVSDVPPPGQVFSGAYGETLEEAASGVPHGQIRATTAGEIRAGGGTVEIAPELSRSGVLNERHVNICLGSGSCPFGPLQPNPVPKSGRIR